MTKLHRKILKDNKNYEYLFENCNDIDILAYSLYRNKISSYEDEPIFKIEYFIKRENNYIERFYSQAKKILRKDKLNDIL